MLSDSDLDLPTLDIYKAIFMFHCPLFSSRHQNYNRNAAGDQIYPIQKNGAERYLYDATGTPLFAKDRHAKMRYARDSAGNQLYPKSKRGPSFVLHPHLYCPMYARDCKGNEYYPKWKGREQMAQLADGEMLVARYACGRQRYPLDRHGNEYFPICKITKKPYYLLDERGVIYRPVTVNNYEMYLELEEAEENVDRIYEKKDALGSTVYTEDHKMKKNSVWTHIKEVCLLALCGLYIGLDLGVKFCIL